jgi:hypothetical protein
MIGSRVLATAAVLALAVVLGGGGPRPEVARAANVAIVDAAARTLDVIDRLQAALAPAIDAAPVGAARVVAGDEDPTEPLSTAADSVLDAAPIASEVRSALADLERARAAQRPESDPLPAGPDGGALASISAQLDSAGQAGASFAETRRRAEGVSAGLVDALDAAAAGDLDSAREELRIGLAAVDEVRALADGAPVLSVWVDTVDAMIRAMQRLVDAVEANDAGEVEAAQADFADLAAGATEADRALRIGLDEAGSALTAVSLGRLADVAAALDELELAVRAARAEIGR